MMMSAGRESIHLLNKINEDIENKKSYAVKQIRSK